MERGGGASGDWNPEGSWVVLEQGERFSPTQFLAFPFDGENSSSGSQESTENESGNGRRSRQQHIKVTPALSLFNTGVGGGERAPSGLSPTIALDVPATGFTGSQRFSPTYSFSSEKGRRMLEAEKTFNLMNFGMSSQSKGSSDSLSSNSDERDNEISSILRSQTELKYNGRDPPFLVGRTTQERATPRRASSFEPKDLAAETDVNMPIMFLNRPKSASDQIQQLVAEIKSKSLAVPAKTFPIDEELETKDFVALLKQKQKERLERQKQKKLKVKQMSSARIKKKPSRGPKPTTAAGWIVEHCRMFLRLAREYALPVTLSHVLAILVGVYIGKSAKPATNSSAAKA